VGAHNPKAVIDVSIIRVVPVADGGAEIVFIVIERATAQHANATACARNTAVRLLLVAYQLILAAQLTLSRKNISPSDPNQSRLSFQDSGLRIPEFQKLRNQNQWGRAQPESRNRRADHPGCS
jgi:hypothetical protein